ncbi:hypothetical protein [uncultured Enterococcus sp.]|uniref:hypothetical protein n=1 Tax=uncultured Enterococcus sp. TaxID=167972 RepID=UPI0025F19DD9|nr:hypothetical protein [uncultured Enterococcus sp.]
MKKIILTSFLLISTLALVACSSQTNSNQKSTSSSTQEISSMESTENSLIKESNSIDKTTSSTIDTEKLTVDNNVNSDMDYDSDTKTFTTPISKIQLISEEFNYRHRGSASEPIFVIQYTVTNTSDEIFNEALKGAHTYLDVTYERENKEFSELSQRVLSDKSDPSYETYLNRDKRLEQSESLNLANAYSIPKNVKKIYIEFFDSKHKTVKRLQVDVPENVQTEVNNYIP